ALAAGINGEVVVAFKVLADGNVTNVRVSIPLDPACDAEAVRLAKLIRWRPGSLGGTPADHDHTIAIPFNAKRYKKYHAKAKRCAPPAPARPADPGGTLYAGKDVDTLAVPQISGGLRALPQYLATNLNYPPEAYRL